METATGTPPLDLPNRLKSERYLDPDGNTVFTEKYLIARGVCCGLGCRHCPYSPRHEAGNTELSDEVKACLKTASGPPS